jgi:hypothetical protein
MAFLPIRGDVGVAVYSEVTVITPVATSVAVILQIKGGETFESLMYRTPLVPMGDDLPDECPTRVHMVDHEDLPPWMRPEVAA